MHINLLFNKKIFLLGISFFSCFLLASQKKTVKTVSIIGAEIVKESLILSAMRTKKSTIFSSQEFDSRILRLDAISVKTLYISNGFLEVSVEDSTRIVDGKVHVFLKISEGKQYFLRSVEIQGNQTITDKTINEILEFIPKKPYDPVTANKKLSLVRQEYEQYGKLFSSIMITDKIGDSVNVQLQVEEGPDVYIDTFFIEGLQNLGEDNITREIAFKSGDLYKKEEIDLTKRRILQTGVFSYAGITPLPVAGSDTTVNVLIELRQFTPKQWSSEGGYFPIEYYRGVEPIPGIGGEIEWRNRSLARSTTNFSARVIVQGLLSEDYLYLIYPKFGMDMDFSNQWFLERRIPTRIRLFYETFTNLGQEGSLSPVMRYGLQLTSHKKFDNFSFIETGLNWEQFIGFENDQQEIEQRTFKLRGFLDRSDDPLYPYNGYRLTGEVSQTGGILGGTRDYVKIDLGINKYNQIHKKIVLAGRLKYGMIFGWEESYNDVQYEKFYLGGSSSLRGWEMLKFKVDENDMPNGDIIRLMMNWEIRFPLFWILGGELFIDGGYLTDSFRNQSIDQIEWDGGFGITLMTPLVPLRLDFAIPLKKSTGGINSWKIQLGASYIF
jgi:outer membrane protein assembly factor BamA